MDNQLRLNDKLLIAFNDGSFIEVKFIVFHDTYFKCVNSEEKLLIIPLSNVKYIEKTN